MAPQTPSAAATDAVAAAVAAAKKEKRAAAAGAAPAMAPRMQTQVQKWAKMTAELGRGRGDSTRGEQMEADEGAAVADGDTPRRRKTTTTTAKKAKVSSSTTPSLAPLRAPHRRDRFVSFGIGEGTKAATTTTTTPPTCLLCLARFATPQQLRDHEVIAPGHRRRRRDPDMCRAAVQRHAAVLVPSSTDTPSTPFPHAHTRRLPRRRADPAPVYTSYAAPVLLQALTASASASTSTSPPAYTHCCLLCRRRFRRRATLRLHERESALHRARLRDPAAVAAAVAGVDAAADAAEAAAQTAAQVADSKNKDSDDPSTALRHPHPRPLLRMRPAPKTADADTDGPPTLYRDRARERRLAFGQKGVVRAKASTADAPAAAPAAPATAAATAATATPSKGAALLGKMGWTAGQGLGAHGTGRVDALSPAAYRAGVGLGAQGGRLGDAAAVAARRTEAGAAAAGGGGSGSSYADFVEQAQEAARRRFQALDQAEAEEKKAAEAAAPVDEQMDDAG